MADDLVESSLRPGTHTPTEPRRIMLVEDDDRNARLVSKRLTEAWPQVEIFRSRTLAEALSTLTERVECVLLDIHIDGETGGGRLEALRQIRAAMPELPIVVMVENEEHGGIALSAGAQEFLVARESDGLGIARVIRHSVQRGRAERFWRELAVLRFQNAETARVQRGLIPHLLIDDERVSTRSGYRPGNRRQVLGGDFFDVIQSSPSRLQIVLGDVSGHGPDEAALGVQLRIAWRTLVLANVPQKQRVPTLDRLVARERHAEHIYATIASVEVDLSTGQATVALAGHPPPMLAQAGAVRLLIEEPGGPPLGLDLPPRWALHKVELDSEWIMMLYSDGLYEGHVTARGSRLGIDGLLEIVSGDGVEAFWRSVPDDLLDHVEGLNDGPLEDDVALLAVRFSA